MISMVRDLHNVFVLFVNAAPVHILSNCRKSCLTISIATCAAQIRNLRDALMHLLLPIKPPRLRFPCPTEIIHQLYIHGLGHCPEPIIRNAESQAMPPTIRFVPLLNITPSSIVYPALPQTTQQYHCPPPPLLTIPYITPRLNLPSTLRQQPNSIKSSQSLTPSHPIPSQLPLKPSS